VITTVIYLLRDVAKPTLEICEYKQEAPPGFVATHFRHRSVEVGWMDREELVAHGQTILLALLPLCLDSANPGVVLLMIDRLRQNPNDQTSSALTIGLQLAELIFKHEKSDQIAWLESVTKEMKENNFLAGSSFYQSILNEGKEIGFVKGKAQGEIELAAALARIEAERLRANVERMEKLQVQRDFIVLYVENNFPELLGFAEQQLEQVTNPYQLNAITRRMLHIHDVGKARVLLAEPAL
jgi:hypothetical protein